MPATPTHTDTPDLVAPDLVALVASRLCHDLISPLGAIGNGVELLSLSGSAGAEIDLIAQSVAQANARLRLFRIAFGAAGDGHTVPAAELTSLASGLSRQGRISFDWQAGGASRAEAKLALLAVLCAENALVHGGRITVEQNGTWTVRAEGPKLRADPDLWGRLDAGARAGADIAPAHVQFALLAAEAARQRRQLAFGLAETEVTLSF